MCDVYGIENDEWYARIDLRHGANCIALRNKKYGASILREPPEDAPPDNCFLCGMPILFPVNRIEGGRFLFEGREYVFPINEPATGCHLHGEVHRMPFALTERRESSIRCRFSATADAPYLTFPHAFEICMEYALRKDGFHHTVTVTNHSAQNMPLFLGFHTTFNTLPQKDSNPESIRVYADITEEYERNMQSDYLPTGRKPAFDEVSRAIACGTYRPFSGKASRHYRGRGSMTLTDTEKRLQIIYGNDEKYRFRLIYNGGADGYICLEPQTCLANCPNAPFSKEEAGFDFLPAGESRVYRSTIRMEEY